ncbi:MAG: hypothetical protein ACFFE2_15670 [Candidatus Thorarchaeota archaeon]
MDYHFIIRSMPSVVSEPDYVGTNGTQRSPIKMFLFVLFVSITVCAIAMNLLAGSMTLPGHLFWLVFHISYISGLVYYFGKKQRLLTRLEEM